MALWFNRGKALELFDDDFSLPDCGSTDEEDAGMRVYLRDDAVRIEDTEISWVQLFLMK